MLFDPTVSDATFVDGRPPKDIKNIIESIREELGLNGERQWRLISARTKLGRVLFEIEEDTSLGPTRLIGKLGNAERARHLHETLNALRDGGFEPPARLTVPESVACLPDRGLVLQEKAPGRHASDLLLQNSGRASFAAADCGRWLAALHQSEVHALPVSTEFEAVSQWADELKDAVPDSAEQLDAIARTIHQELSREGRPLVPTHGDFHPMNILIKGTQRVTGIDLDKFAAREAEADIGWFLMQTAAFGFFEVGSFNSTEFARRAFIACYESEMGQPIRTDRAALYMAMAFLKNLHFELVLLKTGHMQYARPWLEGAAAFLRGDLYLSENP
jgi:aminoglycoside phosphotransferase (APT) family kinase protein